MNDFIELSYEKTPFDEEMIYRVTLRKSQISAVSDTANGSRVTAINGADYYVMESRATIIELLGEEMKKYYALGRLKQGQMNKTEAEYELHLKQLLRDGVILWYKFEGIKFRLADGCFYSPDFAVMLANGEMEIHETKGRWEDDAKVKIKIAASLYPFKFVAIYKIPKKDGGGWREEEF